MRKMNEIKLDAKCAEMVFTLEFWAKPMDGEKLDKSNLDDCIEQIEFDLSELPESIFTDCIASHHGIKQKLCDNLAMTKEQKETCTVQDAVKMTEELFEQLKSNHWNAPSKTGGNTVKVDKAKVANNLSNMTEEEQIAAKELMAKLGIKM